MTKLQATPNALSGPDSLASFLNQIQSIVFEALSFLFGQPLALGQNLQTKIVLSTNPLTIQHGLKRPVQGYVVVRNSAYADIKDADTATPSETINITASAATVVSILFF